MLSSVEPNRKPESRATYSKSREQDGKGWKMNLKGQIEAIQDSRAPFTSSYVRRLNGILRTQSSLSTPLSSAGFILRQVPAICSTDATSSSRVIAWLVHNFK